MASEGREISNLCLLQPELLDETTLKQILEVRCVKLQNMNSMSKEQLVEIFCRVAVPLPQRTYRDNRRGKLLTKMRKKQERSSRKAEPVEEKCSITFGFGETSTSHLSSHECGSHSTGERLKPPPDAVNFQHKKIKLCSSTSKSDDLESIRIKRLKKFEKSDTNGDVLDRIIIRDRRKEKERDEKTSSPSTRQKSTDDSSTNTSIDQPKSHREDSHSSLKDSGTRKIKLKRSHSGSTSETPCSTSTTNKELEVKKNKTKIMWP